MISKKNNDFGVGEMSITEENLILVTTKNNYSELRKLSSTYMQSIQVDMWNIFEI